MKLIHFHAQPAEVLPCTIAPGLLLFTAASIMLPEVTSTCHLTATISYGTILTPYYPSPRFCRIARSFYFGHAPISTEDLSSKTLIRGTELHVESALVDHSTTTLPSKAVVGEFEPESSVYQIYAGIVVTHPGTLESTSVQVIPPSITGTVFVS